VSDAGRTAEAANVWLEVGLRALDLGDRYGLRSFRLDLGDRLADAQGRPMRSLVRMASCVVASATQIDYFIAPILWLWLWEKVPAGAEREAAAYRVGAAALIAGNASIATAVALDLKKVGSNFAAWEQRVRNRGFASSEQLTSDLSGRYLGDDAEAALALFAAFAGNAATTIQ
jgi:hypothetical protein